MLETLIKFRFILNTNYQLVLCYLCVLVFISWISLQGLVGTP